MKNGCSFYNAVTSIGHMSIMIESGERGDS